MYTKQLCNVLLFVVLATFAVSNVSAIRCYTCTTENDPRCFSSPSKYAICDAATKYSVSENQGLKSIFNALAVTSAANPAPYNARYEAYDCAAFKVDYRGEIHILRRCSEKTTSCQDYAKSLGQYGMELKSCNRCYTDLCNTPSLIEVV